MITIIPAFPSKNISSSVIFYQDKLGFTIKHQEKGFAILCRNKIELHLWQADDERWRNKSTTDKSPVVSGAESFIAGTHSCRIELIGVDELYEQLKPLNIIHPNAPIENKPWGTREFAALDNEGNLITFFERTNN